MKMQPSRKILRLILFVFYFYKILNILMGFYGYISYKFRDLQMKICFSSKVLFYTRRTIDKPS